MITGYHRELGHLVGFGDRVGQELKDMNLVLPGQQIDITQQT